MHDRITSYNVCYTKLLRDKKQQLLLGQPGSLHAIQDPAFRLVDRVGEPADLVADGLDLPLLQVDLLDQLV